MPHPHAALPSPPSRRPPVALTPPSFSLSLESTTHLHSLPVMSRPESRTAGDDTTVPCDFCAGRAVVLYCRADFAPRSATPAPRSATPPLPQAPPLPNLRRLLLRARLHLLLRRGPRPLPRLRPRRPQRLLCPPRQRPRRGLLGLPFLARARVAVGLVSETWFGIQEMTVLDEKALRSREEIGKRHGPQCGRRKQAIHKQLMELFERDCSVGGGGRGDDLGPATANAAEKCEVVDGSDGGRERLLEIQGTSFPSSSILKKKKRRKFFFAKRRKIFFMSFLSFSQTPKNEVIFLENDFFENIFQKGLFSAKQTEPKCSLSSLSRFTEVLSSPSLLCFHPQALFALPSSSSSSFAFNPRRRRRLFGSSSRNH